MQKIHFYFSHVWMTTLENTIFVGIFGLFHFLFFCFYYSNIKKEKTKNAIFFSKTSFLTSPKFCRNTILAQCDTICVFKNTQKHCRNGGKTVKKKNLDRFLTLDVDQFLTLETPNLGPAFNSTVCRYIYICCRRGIWSHLGSQRGGFGPRGASRFPWERFRACFIGVSWCRSDALK